MTSVADELVVMTEALQDAIDAHKAGKILTRAQKAVIRANCDPSLPPLAKSGFVPPPKSSRVGWERHTFTDESGRRHMNPETHSLPQVDIGGRVRGKYAPNVISGNKSRTSSAKLRHSASEPAPSAGGKASVLDYAPDALRKGRHDPAAGAAAAAGQSGGGGGGSTSLPSIQLQKADVSVLVEGKRDEAKAFKDLQSMRRAVQNAKAQLAQKELKERRIREARAYEKRAFHDKATFEGVEPASEEEQAELSRRLNAQMRAMEGDPLKRSWYKLFKSMDVDQSGQVTYSELEYMVRGELMQLGEMDLPEAKLKRLWKALDDDGSGYVTTKEFGYFMRKGEAESQGETWKMRHLTKRRREKQAVDSKLNQERDLMEGVKPASDEEVASLSRRFNEEMTKLFDVPGASSAAWFKLFSSMDDDKSGKVTFKEFRHMVRFQLYVPVKQRSEHQLKQVFLALDDDRSGFITAKEFGHFMKKGEAGNSSLTWKQRAQQAKRLQAEEVIGVLTREKAAMAGVTRATDEEVVELSRQFNAAVAGIAGITMKGDPATPSWFKLFRFMDSDGSGQVTFSEFVALVRGELMYIGEAQLPEEKLKSLWKALDDDGSGYVGAKEFSYFMKKGAAGATGLGWKQRARQAKRLEAEEVLRKLNHEKDLMAGVEPAGDAEVASLSRRFNEELRALFDVPGASSASWFKLFAFMDDDKSGKVTFKEFKHMVRFQLHVPEAQLTEYQLKQVFLALDDDRSGFITAKEFGHFMKKGEAGNSSLTWKQRAQQAKRLQAEEVIGLLTQEKAAMKGVIKATDEEVMALSLQFNAAVARVSGSTANGDAATPSWFKLFRFMDADGSGQVTFTEFRDLVRGELMYVSEKQLPEEKLKSLWKALDDDGSGYVGAKEFSYFMKKGAPNVARTTNLEARKILSTRIRQGFEHEKAGLIHKQLRDAEKKAKAHQEEMAGLQQELEQLTSIKGIMKANAFVGKLKKKAQTAKE